MKNIFTIDCEEWFHGAGVPISARATLRRSVERNTHLLLELLVTHSTTATFFTLADVAQEYPNLIKAISNAGHEVASHGYQHQFVYRLTPQEFTHTVQYSKQLLQDITGKPVLGYRAPYFSVTRQSLWALDILAECGYTYDASIAPIRNHRYGIPNTPLMPYVVQTKKNTLLELPITPHSVLGGSALHGGFYLRTFPLGFTASSIQSLNNHGKRCILYIHPWELTNYTPDAPYSSRFLRWRMQHNITSTHRKLNALLQTFSFCSIRDVLVELQQTASIIHL
ncbi:MAG: DUF3473 domain-containing protein [Candidatus Kapaibacterium sp.]